MNIKLIHHILRIQIAADLRVFTVLCCVVLCCVMPCCVNLYCVVVCYPVLWCIALCFVVFCLNHIAEATNYDLPVTVSPFTLLKLPTFYLNSTNSCNIRYLWF